MFVPCLDPHTWIIAKHSSRRSSSGQLLQVVPSPQDLSFLPMTVAAVDHSWCRLGSLHSLHHLQSEHMGWGVLPLQPLVVVSCASSSEVAVANERMMPVEFEYDRVCQPTILQAFVQHQPIAKAAFISIHRLFSVDSGAQGITIVGGGSASGSGLARLIVLKLGIGSSCNLLQKSSVVNHFILSVRCGIPQRSIWTHTHKQTTCNWENKYGGRDFCRNIKCL